MNPATTKSAIAIMAEAIPTASRIETMTGVLSGRGLSTKMQCDRDNNPPESIASSTEASVTLCFLVKTILGKCLQLRIEIQF